MGEGAPRRSETGQRLDAGNIKDLAEWAGPASSPWAQWKWIFCAGLNGLRPGIAEMMDWAEEASKPGKPPITELDFSNAALKVGFKDSYQETSGFIFFVLTQKLMKNIIAIGG